MGKKLTGLLLLLMLIILCTSVVSAENSLLIQGISDYYNGNYKQAVENFEKLLADDRENIDAVYYQTLAFLELNDIARARENISFLNERGYNVGMIHWKLGELYLNKNQYYDSPFYNEAKKELEKARELGISTAGLHSYLALAYQGLGYIEKAAEEFELAIEKGQLIDDYISLASIYKETGKYDRALEIYEKAVQESPDNVSIYLNMGDIYLEKGEYSRAIDVLKKGVNLKSSMVALKMNLALAYMHNEDFEEAKKYFMEVIDDNENIYQAYFYLGEIYNKIENNHELAVNYYDQAISYNKNYVRAYLALGDLYLEREETYKAMAQYLKALENNENYPDAHFRLALAYIQMDMKTAAIEELRKTIHLDNTNNEARLLLNKLQEE
ncbi:MAG: tetratricopeptide repeat protein [Halanaerobiaceae bacterium]|nr:tetratricopeptide repeat protein [Halanaerobiaceae bacterium]